MDLYNSQALIGGLEAPIIDPPTNHEILPSNPTAPSLPEVRQSLSQEPPVELVCPSPIIGGSPIRPNGQMNDIHVLIVDDNDINLKVSQLTANSLTQKTSSLSRNIGPLNPFLVT